MEGANKILQLLYDPNVKSENIKTLLEEKNIFKSLFQLNSHPDVISKCLDIFDEIASHHIILENEIDPLMILLGKCSESVVKNIYCSLGKMLPSNITCHL